MRKEVVAGVFGGVLVATAWALAGAGPRNSDRQPPIADGAATVRVVPDGEGGVHLYIVENRWFGVYHLDLGAAKCRLKVARDFSGDMKVEQIGREHVPSVESVKATVGGFSQRRGHHARPSGSAPQLQRSP